MYVNYFFINFTCKTKESQCLCLIFLILTLKKFCFDIGVTCWGTEVASSFFPCIARL